MPSRRQNSNFCRKTKYAATNMGNRRAQRTDEQRQSDSAKVRVTMKNITAKAEELVEVKKHAATSLLEKQTSKHDIGGGGLLGEVENSNGHVANNVESGDSHAGLDFGSLIGNTVRSAIATQIPHNIEGSVHKLEGKARSVTRKSDDSVDGEVATAMKIVEMMGLVHKAIDKIQKVIHILHKVTDKVHKGTEEVFKVTYKVFKVTYKFNKTTYEVIHSMEKNFKNMVKAVFSLIPMASIIKVVEGMLKGSLAAWKKAIKLTAKVVLLPYTITKKVLHKTSKVMGLIFGNEVPKLVDPVSNL
ncbi:hypothetical protein ACI65C_000937, partial [Semiaphis heraclei]